MALRDKMVKNAQPYLQPGEQVQAVFGAQTANQYWVLLSAFIVLFTNKYRIVAVTDRRILVLGGGRWTQTKVKEVVAEVPRGVLIGPASGLWWKCESLGQRLYVHKRFHKDVTRADTLRPAGAAPQGQPAAPQYGGPPPMAPPGPMAPMAPMAPPPPPPGQPGPPPSYGINDPTVVRPRPDQPPPPQ